MKKEGGQPGCSTQPWERQVTAPSLVILTGAYPSRKHCTILRWE